MVLVVGYARPLNGGELNPEMFNLSCVTRIKS